MTSRLTLAGLTLAAGLTACSDTRTIDTPIPEGMSAGQLSLNPVFSQSAKTIAASLGDFGLTYDRVRVTVRNNPDTSLVVVDTTVAFGPSSNNLTLNIKVPLRIRGQVFNTRVQYVGNAGVLYGGKVLVKSYGIGEAAPEQPALVLNFEGPGAKLKTLTISPDPVQLVGSSTMPVTIAAVDSSGATITVPPLLFTSSDASVATVSTSGSNRSVQSFGKRGSARIIATAPNGISDTLSANVSLPATAIALVSGGGQNGTVGAPLIAPAVVQVNASDNVGVAGVAVTFAPPIGGSVNPATATTDANGRASTTMTLATNVTGPQSFVATAAGFNVAVPATAAAGAASAATSTITTSVATIKADDATPTTVILQVKDQYGNNTTAVGGATVRLTTNLGHFGSIGAVTSTDAMPLGNGKYSAELFSSRSGTATITAMIGETSVTNQATVNVAAIPVAVIVLISDGQTGVAGATLEAPAVVQVKSAEGVGIADVLVTFTAPNGASVGTATATTDANGRASTTLKLATTVGTQTFKATAGGFSVDIPASAVAGPASPATSTISANVAQINADNSSSAIVTVRTKDQYGNVIAGGGANVTLTTTLGHWESASPTTAATDNHDGTYTATLTSAQSGMATVTAKIGGVALTTPALTITALALPLDHFDVTFANGSPVSGNIGAGVATPVKITARDQLGNVVTSYIGRPTLTSPASSLIGGPQILAPAAVSGVSTTTVKFGTLAPNVMLNAADAGKVGQSAAFNVVAGPPASIKANADKNSFVYAMGQSPTEYPAIIVLDGLANPVSNQEVSFSNSGPCAVVSPFKTDAQGTIALSAANLTIPTQSATTPFSCDLVSSIAGLTPLHIALLAQQPSGSTVWTGALSDAWETSDNWTANLPSTTRSAFIPAAQPSNPIAYPVLHGGASILSIDVEDGARVNLNSNTLSVYQNIDARGSGSITSGTISVPTGATGGTMRGSLPNVNCQSGSPKLNGLTQLNGTLTLGGACALDLFGNMMSVSGALTTSGTGGLVMTQAGSEMRVDGSASFGSSTNQLTAGKLTVLGNFSQTGGTFAPSGSHTVVIGPAATQNQSVTFQDVTNSSFQNLNVIVSPNRTVTINSAVKVLGNLTIGSAGGGTLSLPAGLTSLSGSMTVTGTMNLAIDGVVNATSLTLGHGTVTVTGGGLVVLASGMLRLDNDLHLVVNVPGNVGALTTTCTAGSNVTITGDNVQAVQALKQLCNIP